MQESLHKKNKKVGNFLNNPIYITTLIKEELPMAFQNYKYRKEGSPSP